MKLTTLKTATGTSAARLDGDTYTLLPYADLSILMAAGDWRAAAAAEGGETVAAAEATLTTLLPSPSKVICMGRNYAEHVAEFGHEMPEAPVMFAKFADSLTGPYDDLPMPAESEQLDWEVELALVIGKEGRRIPKEQAHEYIAGYTVSNDVSVRDFQRRSKEWLAGKAWTSLTPIGPWLVTEDELPRYAEGLEVLTLVDGVEKQRGNTEQFIFDIPTIIADMSTWTVLRPGDVILTGTPSGVGLGRKPPEFLKPGQTLTTRIERVGELVNKIG
ncbi:fumarylacetoacetate hydrolase family protein [Streptomyces brasiliensis]|uniref:Fumarylacetoacetase-like C-terminal domain-containing protein n=1 Tax=Streptomyces brasiliensis TaxID=1954 RepID=A0A917NYW1_9ACTN|nr:fumarylacetoacetate hydrolase family protein [Streptomyces brasiliensis]GGJ42764.1 hypothetical protein GCM10010121_062510 [Streptomyces brasiliensis]